MENKKTTNVVNQNNKKKEKNTFRLLTATVVNDYNKLKEDFDNMTAVERKEFSIRKHIEENGFIRIPVEGKSKADKADKADKGKDREEDK